MKNYFLTAISIVGSLLLPNPIWAQTGKNLPTIIPPGPTTAALGKYVDTPVSPYTGVPNISIPLYEIKSRDITVPISLSYHAGGIRVEEEASWVGLGWSLQAGGVVGRTIRGKDDMRYYLGYHEDVMPPFIYPGYTSACKGSDLQGDATDHYPDYCARPPSDESDWEPDAFFFNFLTQSGKFIYSRDGIPHLLEQAKLKISWLPAKAGFLVATPDGYHYEFFVDEVRTEGAVAWHLTKIISPQGEQVTFSYERTPVALFGVQPRSEIKNIETIGGCAPGLVDDNSATAQSLTEPYLSRIDFSTGYVTFERDAQNREDFNGAARLRYVRVYQTGISSPVKEYELLSSYFISPLERRGEENHSISDQEHNYAGKRLRLDGVLERGGTQQKPPYRFTYNSLALPYKTSNNYDHWGFFNAAHNNSLIPGYEGFSPLSQSYVRYDGANREPDAQACMADMLVQIQYPTGGRRQFTFESNDYGNMHKDDLYPWQERVVTASQRSFANGTLDTQSPKTFTIAAQADVPSGGTPVVLYLQLQQFCNSGQNCQSVEDNSTFVKIRQVDGPFISVWSVANTGLGYFTKQVVLPPGKYELSAQASVNSLATKYAWGALTIRDKLFVPSYSKIGGGVRIAAVRSIDNPNGNLNLVRKYRYAQEVVDSLGTHQVSQGILMSRPRYHRYVERYYYYDTHQEQNGKPVLSVGTCRAFQLCSYSSSQLSNSAQGAILGYSQVEEWHGEQAEGGKTVYNYGNQEDIVYDYWERPPGIPNIPYALNGYLNSQTDYQFRDGRFRLVKQLTNSYAVAKNDIIPGVARGPLNRLLLDDKIGCAACSAPLHRYLLYSRLIQKLNTTERLYDASDATRNWQTSTDYAYDTHQTGHLQVSQIRTTRSDGATQITDLTYPADYTQVSNGPLAVMRSEEIFQHALVVENTSSVLNPGQTIPRLTSGQYTEYSRPNANCVYLPSAKYALEVSQPTVGVGVSAPNLPPTSRYTLKTLLNYEPATGNLVQMKSVHDGPTTFLWGYSQTLPVAQIRNASASQVTAALQRLGALPTALPTNNLALQQLLSQLRQQLPQAQTTSFIYEPLVGLTSQTGPDGRTIFYEYDVFTRLVRTRDEQGRILSQQQYHYAGK